jgi:hypothetical protein
MLRGQLAIEKLQLVLGEGHHLVLTEMVEAPLSRMAQELMDPPRSRR